MSTDKNKEDIFFSNVEMYYLKQKISEEKNKILMEEPCPLYEPENLED